MTTTLCQGDIIGCNDDDGPALFDSETEAWKEIADHMIEGLQQFVRGEREREDTDFDCDEWPVEVYVTEDGLILSAEIENGSSGKILFDPKLKNDAKSID